MRSLTGGTGLIRWFSRTSFDEAVWKLNQTSPWCIDCTPVRMTMAQDLVTSGRLVGLDRGAVYELLEPPDDYRNPYPVEPKFPDSVDQILKWELAPSGIDIVYLFVGLDAEDKVVSTGVWAD